jgi:hypothetical protein
MNGIAREYKTRQELVNGTAPVRTIDAHSIPHWKAGKAVRALEAANASDGLVRLQNLTLRLYAQAFGVSVGSLVLAKRLTPEQREAVKRGKRPLLPPVTMKALPAPVSPQERLASVVAEVGVGVAFDMLVAFDSNKVSAA